MANSYQEAPVEPTVVHTTYSNSISLIKVPQFLAERWKQAKDRSIIATSYTCPETGNMRIKVDADGSNGVTEFVAQPPQPFKALLIQERPHNEGSADILCQLQESKTFVPNFDKSYLSMLKQRHTNTAKNNSRSTIEEKRESNDFDNSQTLFRYYAPRPISSGNDSTTEESWNTFTNQAASRNKVRGRKMITVDENTMKVRLFQLFETAGDDGLQLKQIVAQAGQPFNYVKNMVDEIASQRKRHSDRKLMYFLKDYTPPSATEEDAPAKKVKRV